MSKALTLNRLLEQVYKRVPLIKLLSLILIQKLDCPIITIQFCLDESEILVIKAGYTNLNFALPVGCSHNHSLLLDPEEYELIFNFIEKRYECLYYNS